MLWERRSNGGDHIPQRNRGNNYLLSTLLRMESVEFIFLGFETWTHRVSINISTLRLRETFNSLH